MNDYLQTEFYYYPGKIYLPEPLGKVSLEYFINAHKNPSEKIKEVFRQIAKAEQDKDFKLKSELKQNNLYYFNMCIHTDGLGRSYSNITGFTGLCLLDFDHIENAEEFKQWVFDNLPSCICAYLTSSRKGCRFVVRIPIVESVNQFKEYYYGLSAYFEKYAGYDGSGQNCALPNFLSWDENILWREDATVWDIRGIKLNEFPTGVPEDFEPNEIINAEDEAEVKMIAERGINNIADNGHFQLRSIALALGGHIGYNYISYEDAEDHIHELIRCNPYLQKGVAGYCKTASQMLKKGVLSPLKLRRNERKVPKR